MKKVVILSAVLSVACGGTVAAKSPLFGNFESRANDPAYNPEAESLSVELAAPVAPSVRVEEAPVSVGRPNKAEKISLGGE